MLHSTHTQVVHIAMQNLKLLIPFETFRSKRRDPGIYPGGAGTALPARTTPAAAGRRDRDATGLSALHSACDVAAAGSARRREEAAGGGLATAGLGALTWALTIGPGRDGWTARAVIGAAASAGLLVLFVLLALISQGLAADRN
jgi:hypothetical protein